MFKFDSETVWAIRKHLKPAPLIAGAIAGGLLACVALFLFVMPTKAANGIRVIYSLDARANDQEIVKLIDDARKYAYFAVYYFTQKDIADALIRAKERGLDVEGVTDAAATAGSNKSVVASLRAAGIPVEVQKHEDGIMHMKVLVTDKAYASGSYNWTQAATDANDEVLEIGTDQAVHAQYLSIMKKVLSANQGSGDGSNDPAIGDAGELVRPGPVPTYDFSETPKHIGERATVTGTVFKVQSTKGGTIFFDFCETPDGCPFSAVVFASDAKRFSDLSKYKGKASMTGVIRSYQGKAEMMISDPGQIE